MDTSEIRRWAELGSVVRVVDGAAVVTRMGVGVDLLVVSVLKE